MTTQKIIGACKIVDLTKLFVSEFNAREQGQESTNNENFVWLCNSIKSEGLIEPIVVRSVGDRFEIVAGTRRFAALKHIGAEQAQVVVKEMSDNDVRIASLVENIHREDLSEDEKQKILTEIYLTTWDEWKPKVYDQYYETDENKIKFARSFLNRLHNVENRSLVNYSKVHSNLGEHKEQKIFPTDKFKELSLRVGYSWSTQINILKGFGAIKELAKDYYEELPKTIRELLDEADKELKLKEADKKKLAKRAYNAYKEERKPRKKPTTKKGRVENVIKRFKKEKIREDVKKEHKKKQPSQSKPELEKLTSAVRGREKILSLGYDLFEVLTGQSPSNNQETNETFTKNTVATQTMKELVTFISGGTEISAQRNLVIPLNMALSRYRDMLYDAGESAKRKEDLGSR